MILILIFAEALGLYGLIIALILSQWLLKFREQNQYNYVIWNYLFEIFSLFSFLQNYINNTALIH